MSAASQTSGRRSFALAEFTIGRLGDSPARGADASLALPYAFADTVARHLLLVLPAATRELARWRTLAHGIPNSRLRSSATSALAKRGNVEGAALFATLAPPAYRRATVRALVALQSAYNYLDLLSELPSRDPLVNGEQLHEALINAVDPSVAHPDYYAHNLDRGDGGYLTTILDTCRRAVLELPSFPALAPVIQGAAARIARFQTLNLTEAQGSHEELREWAGQLAPPGADLRWWETAGSAGSSLAMHALIATAANPHIDRDRARAVDAVYFTPAGALHSLLDALVDIDEDRVQRQRSLIGYYDSPTDAAMRISLLADRARAAATSLPNSHAHRVIFTAMCSYYLSAPQSDTARAQRIAAALSGSLGTPLTAALSMFRARRLLQAATNRSYT
jgi:tetraprenyl-beta-curcumene synthase